MAVGVDANKSADSYSSNMRTAEIFHFELLRIAEVPCYFFNKESKSPSFSSYKGKLEGNLETFFKRR
jgi:hypothetical protein